MRLVRESSGIKASDLTRDMKPIAPAKSEDQTHSTKFIPEHMSRLARMAASNQKRIDVVFLPQHHNSPYRDGVSKGSQQRSTHSQYMIARELYKKTAQLPRSKSALRRFRRKHSDKIVYVFVEGSGTDLTTRHYYRLLRANPRFFRKVRKAFPGEKLPRSYKELTPEQRKLLRDEDAVDVLFYLGRSLIIKGADKKLLIDRGLKAIGRYSTLKKLFDLFEPFRSGDKFDHFCLIYGKNNELRRYVMDLRERVAVRRIRRLATSRRYDSKRMIYLVYGALHKFPKYSGLNVKIPQGFSKMYESAYDRYGLSKKECMKDVRRIGLLLEIARTGHKKWPKRTRRKLERIALEYLKDMWPMSRGALTVDQAMQMSTVYLVREALKLVDPLSAKKYLEDIVMAFASYATQTIMGAFNLFTFDTKS